MLSRLIETDYPLYVEETNDVVSLHKLLSRSPAPQKDMILRTEDAWQASYYDGYRGETPKRDLDDNAL